MKGINHCVIVRRIRRHTKWPRHHDAGTTVPPPTHSDGTLHWNIQAHTHTPHSHTDTHIFGGDPGGIRGQIAKFDGSFVSRTNKRRYSCQQDEHTHACKQALILRKTTRLFCLHSAVRANAGGGIRYVFVTPFNPLP